MNEQQLRRLLQRLLAFSAPLPLALLGGACGGSTLVDSAGEAGSGANAGMPAGGASGHAGAGAGGAAASAGAAATGDGGMSAGGAGAGAGGAGGSGGDSCKSQPLNVCGSGVAAIPKTCVAASMASVGTTLPMATCGEICDAVYLQSCSVTAVDSTSITVLCYSPCPAAAGGAGRRPAGLGESPCAGFSDIGGYFAEIARLEAASVPAFRILRDELRSHGAPKRLLRAAARAARDEVRHARATSALARRYGAEAHVAHVTRGAQRSLEAIAIENAIEGCVRETYAALLATHQAQRATDPVVRAAMARIARDETRHAALSWQVARWLDARLAPAAKRRVEQAKQAAVRELLGSLRAEREAPFADEVGLPPPAVAMALATGIEQTLWS